MIRRSLTLAGVVVLVLSSVACQSSGGGSKTPHDAAPGGASTAGEDGEDAEEDAEAGDGDEARGTARAANEVKHLVDELNSSTETCLAALERETSTADLGLDAETTESCSAAGVAHDRGVLLSVVTECGGDSCSVLRWLLVPLEGSLVFIDQMGGGIAFFPSLDSYVFDAVPEAKTEEEFYQSSSWPPVLFKAEVGESPDIAEEEAKRVLFANCMSPTLAPDEAHFYCRTTRGDVARVPMSGGELGKGGPVEIIVENPTGKLPALVSYAYVYPEAVDFEAPDQFTFSVVSTDNGASFFRVKLDAEGAVVSVDEFSPSPLRPQQSG